MSIAIQMDLPTGMGQEQYDAVNEEMGIQDNPPDGMLVHFGGEGPNGWRITDVWESREHFDRFNEERLFPAIRKVTGFDPAQAPPPGSNASQAEWPVHTLITR